MRKSTYIITVLAFIASSCHESIEKRAAREADEYTKKNCPVMIAENIVNDSMTFDSNTRTVSYHYSLNGNADTSLINRTDIKKALLQSVVNATNLRAYKEAGFKFRYAYYSTKHKGQKLLDVTFTEKDYMPK